MKVMLLKYFMPLILFHFFCQTLDAQSPWEKWVDNFCSTYETLDIPRFQLSYERYLSTVPPQSNLVVQEKFFLQSSHEIESFTNGAYDPLERALALYIIRLHLSRIEVQISWDSASIVDDSGIFHQPNGKNWYILLLRYWIDLDVTPEELFQFGLNEIAFVKSKMKMIQEQSGLDSLHFEEKLHSTSQVLPTQKATHDAIQRFASTIQEKLSAYFPDIDKTPLLRIKLSTDQGLRHVPGYYRSNTFFYNFIEPFYQRKIAWLFLHEGNPGHHYEVHHSRRNQYSKLQNLLNFPSYSEGWAAYIEDLAIELKMYKDPLDEYGKWEWDLIRSVRVPLDVGINYYGWNDEKALHFWKQHIDNLDHIGLREIARMRRWPCQVITYKYGADQIEQWKKLLGVDHSPDSAMQFHRELLKYGRLPFSVLKGQILTNTTEN